MKPKQIKECLIADMEMLRSKTWIPDDDSIDAHIEMINRLFALIKKQS